MRYYFISLLLIIVDQLTKHKIRVGMAVNESLPIFNDVFHITYVQNFGAAFSILQGKQAFLIGITLIALIGMLLYMSIKIRKNHWLLTLSLSFIIGGGLGNLIDRIRMGYVVDFFDFRVFPVFNVADICVCLGCGMLILYVFFFESPGKREKEA